MPEYKTIAPMDFPRSTSDTGISGHAGFE